MWCLQLCSSFSGLLWLFGSFVILHVYSMCRLCLPWLNLLLSISLFLMLLWIGFFFFIFLKIIHCCCSIAKLYLTLCMDCSTAGFPVLHYFPELTQTYAHRVVDCIQPSHTLLPPSLSAFNLFQHQGLSQWVSSSHQVAKVLELQLQHQYLQWICIIDFG